MKRLLLLPGGLLLALLIGAYLWLGASAPPEPTALAGVSARPAQPEDDLPPEGTRSLFDHLVREQGSLPFPFTRLMAMVDAYAPPGGRSAALLIPDGRSLLKGFANFEKPRIVFAPGFNPPAGAAFAPLLKGRLFLGFVENADEIEVISYNEDAGRFEFQLVEDYCEGCTPRIVYARRAVCTTCHSGAAPIFPVRPWEETSVQPAISARLREHIAGAEYFGVALRHDLGDGQRFDDLTEIGARLPVTQAIWRDGCGTAGEACRRALLKAALAYLADPGGFGPDAPLAQAVVAAQQRAWPAAGIVVPDGDLRSRNPFDAALYEESLLKQLRQLLFPQPAPVRSGDKLADFDALPPLPPEFDPLRSRPPREVLDAQALDGVYGLAQLFAADDLDRLQRHAGYDLDALLAAVDAMDPVLFADATAARRVPIMRGLLVALGVAAPPAYCCDSVAEMSAPVVQGEPPLELAADSVLKPFERYCFGCHRGNPSARLNFMAGADEAAVLARLQEVDAIRDALDFERYQGTRKEGQLMPPEDSWQRAELMDAIAAGQDPRPAMLEQVPSLFDF